MATAGNENITKKSGSMDSSCSKETMVYKWIIHGKKWRQK